MKNRSVWPRRLLIACVVIAVPAAMIAYVDSHRVDPATISQSKLHDVATTGKGTRLEWVPQHKVVIRESELGARQLVEEYIARLIAKNPDAGVQAKFNYSSGEVHVIGDEAIYDASLPGTFHPYFYHALRHEYGHAAFTDWLISKGVGMRDVTRMANTERGKAGSPAAVDLRPVFAEWKAGSETVYGQAYLSQTLPEYLAESYARYLEGRRVPPKTRLFIERQYAARRVDARH